MIGVKRRAEARLLRIPGVTGVDIGYKEVGGRSTQQLAIRVLVKLKGPVRAVHQIPSFIEGYPTDVIQREIKLHALPDPTIYDPLVGGCSVGPCRLVDIYAYAGTLGCLVEDRTTGAVMGLSNFHVLCVNNDCAAGDTMVQPSQLEGGICPDNVIGTLARWHLGDGMDAAIMTLDSARGFSSRIVEIGQLYGTAEVSLGDKVRKRGRTSGLKYGIVDSVDFTSATDYGFDIGLVTLRGQIGIKPYPVGDVFSRHGDSGSAVVNAQSMVVGLLYAGDDAGYGVANPIIPVLQRLNVNLYLGGEATSIPFTAIWPSDVPVPRIENSGMPMQPVIASPTTSARIDRRLRLKGTANIACTVQFVMNMAQYQAFQRFFRDDLNSGASVFSVPFRYPSPNVLTDWLARFPSNYQASHNDGIMTIKANFTLIRPVAVAALANPLGYGDFLVHPDRNPFICADGHSYAVKI